MIPCMGIVWGALFLSEDITMSMTIALAIILSGIAIANLRKDKIRI
jgi:drug/metabolite transporter (DMT)-like permease